MGGGKYKYRERGHCAPPTFATGPCHLVPGVDLAEDRPAAGRPGVNRLETNGGMHC
jgi:hypothetical protein